MRSDGRRIGGGAGSRGWLTDVETALSEQRMIEIVREAMTREGIQEDVLVVGEFYPRGHTGAGFVGGIAGGSIGDAGGDLVGAVGTVAGYLAGAHAADGAQGLPKRMLVAVSPQAVYGFVEHSRRKEPGNLIFRVPREELKTKVHQRVNVRVLELLEERTGAAIELEGNRIPLTHSHDVIRELGH
jgi:hypothetical protein